MCFVNINIIINTTLMVEEMFESNSLTLTNKFLSYLKKKQINFYQIYMSFFLHKNLTSVKS